MKRSLQQAGIRGASLLLALLVTGCGSLINTERPAESIYWLTPLSSGVAPPDAPAHIRLDVSAVEALDTDRVLVLGSNAAIRQLGHARWAEFLPELLATSLAQSLAASGVEVSQDRHSAANDACVLRLEVQAFYGRSRDGVVRSVQGLVDGKLTCATFSHVVKAAAEAPGARGEVEIVAAFQRVLDDLTVELLTQLSENHTTP